MKREPLTSRPLACFLRAPGVGLALVDLASKIVHRGYPLAGGADAASAIAVAIARVAFGLAPESTSDEVSLARHLREDWLTFGGSVAIGTRGAFPAPPSQSGSRSGASFATPHSPENDAWINWDAIKANLLERGLTIESRAARSALLSTSQMCAVIEIRDGVGKVLAEGKGLTDGEALLGALGEAVERLVAQLPSPERMFVATPRELVAAGLEVPNFAAEARDLFSNDLPLEWVSAATFSGRSGALPAELVYYPFQPSSGVKAFSVQHTAGLAAGATIGAASAAGLREAVETDAYWLSMRSRRVCARFTDLCDTPVPQIQRLVRSLADIGIITHAGLISFDWPMPIAHVVLETTSESLPALSHGLALGADPFAALERALLEAIQVYTGLEKVSQQYWPEISVGLSRAADPPLLWSDPSHAGRIVEMFNDAPSIDLDTARPQVSSVGHLVTWMADRGMTAWCAHLGSYEGLEVARVFIDGAVSPFSERGQPSPRVQRTLSQFGLRYPYLDPVLT